MNEIKLLESEIKYNQHTTLTILKDINERLNVIEEKMRMMEAKTNSLYDELHVITRL